jgi:hypothetical protein
MRTGWHAGSANVFFAFAAVIIAGSAGCRGGTVSSTADAGFDAAATTDGGVRPAVIVASGTSGQPCTSGCAGDAGPDAAGANVCSNTLPPQIIADVKAQIWPTPVCVVPPPPGGVVSPLTGNCDPAPLSSDPNGLQVHYCDGPDLPSSPGVCVPFDPSNPQTGLGACYPRCTFSTDGSRAIGCIGADTCAFFRFNPVPLPDAGASADGGVATGVTGVGFCQGTCQKDADCADLNVGGANFVCQTDLGYCTPQPVVRTKPLGAPCTVADSDAGACNCFAGADGSGYCSTRCVVGGVPCPMGWVCDPGEPANVTVLGLMTTFPVLAPTQGMVGMCAPPCSPILDGGAGSDAAPAPDAGASDATDDGALPSDGGTEAGAADATLDGGDASSDDGGDASADATVDGSSADGASADAAPSDGATPDAGADGAGGAGTNGSCLPNSSCVSGGVVGADCLPQ